MSEKLDALQSLQRINLHMMPCDVIGHEKVIYSACARPIEKMNRGDEEHGLSDKCANAVSCGSCPAAKMRAEEVKKGEAIYYVIPGVNDPLDEFRAKHLKSMGMRSSDIPSYQRGFNRDLKNKTKSIAKPVASKAATVATKSKQAKQPTHVNMDDALAAAVTE